MAYALKLSKIMVFFEMSCLGVAYGKEKSLPIIFV